MCDFYLFPRMQTKMKCFYVQGHGGGSADFGDCAAEGRTHRRFQNSLATEREHRKGSRF
jgi:hypothetical protein